jgi:nanoRNase/pAp phosphatase (c-di-AMP/oligoRNAs hydrolase)
MSQLENQIMDLGNGQFEYVQDVWMREMLVNAWQAITITETWDFVREDTDSFMFSRDPRIEIITNKMVELGYGGHSGASFGCTMRNMQFIAKYGEEKFKQEILSNQKKI